MNICIENKRKGVFTLKITVPFKALETTMQLVTSVTAGRMITEELKNLIIVVRDNQIKFSASARTLMSAFDIEADVQVEDIDVPTEDGSFIHVLRAKDINNVLNTFRGLTRTVATTVTFEIEENKATMIVHEEPASEDVDNASKYVQDSRFIIGKPKRNKLIEREVQRFNTIPTDDQFTEIPFDNLDYYLTSLLPMVAKETREGVRDVTFGEELAYALVLTHVAITQNGLPEVFKGFSLQNTYLKFLQDFIGDNETFKVHKHVVGNGQVTLTFKVPSAVAIVDTGDLTRARDMSSFCQLPPNYVEVDRFYLMDVLKRVALSSEATTVGVRIADGFAQMRLQTQTVEQEIPLFSCEGEGEYVFTLKPEIIDSMIMSHNDYALESVRVHLGFNESGTITLGVTDEQGFWNTKMDNLSMSKAQINFN